mmetsp:Transcript_32051/g.98960  ORF Transcript_32051/g.98960 Transcript_32051/m.98960 type:complete len:226 (-) Transcript_32051:1392-2069(-)
MPFARTCAATGGRRQDTRESVAGAAGPPINAPSWPTTVGHVNALPSNDNRISPCRPRCVVRSITASNREETAPGPRAQRSNTRSVNASSAPSATSPSASARPQTHEIGTLWNRSAPAAPVDINAPSRAPAVSSNSSSGTPDNTTPGKRASSLRAMANALRDVVKEGGGPGADTAAHASRTSFCLYGLSKTIADAAAVSARSSPGSNDSDRHASAPVFRTRRRASK